jgi:hypothetical protein
MLLLSINDISIPWLNQVMETNSITGFEARRVGEGVGLMGILAIVTLESEDDSIPPTIVVKIQTTDEQNLAVADTYRTYLREVSFYQHLSQDCGIETPDCYYSLLDEEKNQFLLVLQDLSELQPIDQIEGSDRSQTLLAVEQLARLHSKYWNKLDEGKCADMFDWNDLWPSVIESYVPMLEGSIEKTKTLVPEKTANFLKLFGEQLERLLPKLSEQRTFIHGDYRLDNFFFSKDYSDILVIDWGNSGKGPAMFDFSYFLTTCLDVELRRSIEKDAVQLYCDTLRTNGVEGYDAADCWRDYVWGVPLAFYIPIIVMSSMGAGNDRGDLLVQTIYDRGVAAMVDHETHLSGLI